MKTIFAIVGAVILIILGIYAGIWYQKPTLEELAEQNTELAIKDTVRQKQLNDLTVVYRRLSREYVGEIEAKKFLQRQNEDLAEELEETEQDLLFVSSSRAELVDSLSGLSEVFQDSQEIRIAIDEEKVYDRGRIGVTGNVILDRALMEDAQTDLAVRLRMSPLLTLSRLPLGGAEVTLDFGDMPVTVDSIDSVLNLDDPIRERARTKMPPIAKVSLGLNAVALGVILVVALF